MNTFKSEGARIAEIKAEAMKLFGGKRPRNNPMALVLLSTIAQFESNVTRAQECARSAADCFRESAANLERGCISATTGSLSSIRDRDLHAATAAALGGVIVSMWEAMNWEA